MAAVVPSMCSAKLDLYNELCTYVGVYAQLSWGAQPVLIQAAHIAPVVALV